MIHRKKDPLAGKYNGLGGKRENNFTEEPRMAIFREIQEEAGINLSEAESVKYAGVVIWESNHDVVNHSSGMFCFIATLRSRQVTWDTLDSPEGKLEWKDLDWVCDPQNPAVVSNIPKFLPLMIKFRKPRLYELKYDVDKLIRMKVRALTIDKTI